MILFQCSESLESLLEEDEEFEFFLALLGEVNKISLFLISFVPLLFFISFVLLILKFLFSFLLSFASTIKFISSEDKAE